LSTRARGRLGAGFAEALFPEFPLSGKVQVCSMT
jgi:hypothetical protein